MGLSLRIAGLALLLTGIAFVATALAAGVKVINVGDDFFVKNSSHTPTVHVAKGRTVRWKWIGVQDHNVTVVSGPAKFHSKTQSSGTFSKKITRPGTYVLECTIHGFKMRLIVKA
jgi:plastocyanin